MGRRKWLPFFIIAAGFGAAALLMVTGPKVELRPAAAIAPLVRVVEVQPQTLQLRSRTHGTVVPRTESDLIPEVDGRVLEMSPSLVSGGFFDKGDMLLRIDSLDYEVALEQARAGVARGESELEDARRNLDRQQDLIRRGATSHAQRDDAQYRLQVAEATLREARARLARAERDLERTRLVAPYDGRVRTKRVDIGQFVKRGDVLGTIYATDYAEVRVPIHDEELQYLDLPLGFATDPAAASVAVTLRARFAGEEHTWNGKVVRTEGELDPGTRMVNVVARVPEPYVTDGHRPPLSVGLFVAVEIHGQTLPDLIVLPRAALRGGDRVLVVDEASRLRFRSVDVLRRANEQVYLSGGLSPGERVCVSPLPTTADGMLVRLIEEPSATLAQNPSAGPAS